MPPSSFPLPRLLSQQFPRLIDLLWFYAKVQRSVESAIWPNVWKWFLSLFTDSLPFLGGVGLSPGSWHHGLVRVDFVSCLFVDSVAMIRGWNETEESSRSPLAFHLLRHRRISHLFQIVSFFSPLHFWGLQSLRRETFVLGVLGKILGARGVWKESLLNGDPRSLRRFLKPVSLSLSL